MGGQEIMEHSKKNIVPSDWGHFSVKQKIDFIDKLITISNQK